MRVAYYAMVDTVSRAEPVVLMLHRHPEAAIRSFGDVLSDPQGVPAHHPEDFELREVVVLTDEGFEVTDVCVITGKQWLAAQPPPGGANAQA